MNGRRVVITGLGLITPLGNDVETTWQALRNARSGINMLEQFDTSDFTTRFGGSVKNFDCSPYLSDKEARRMDVFIGFRSDRRGYRP